VVQIKGHSVSLSHHFEYYINEEECLDEGVSAVQIRGYINQRNRERCSKDLIQKFPQIQKIRVVGWRKGRSVPAEGVGASFSIVAD
jgi:hypothetical protein